MILQLVGTEAGPGFPPGHLLRWDVSAVALLAPWCSKVGYERGCFYDRRGNLNSLFKRQYFYTLQTCRPSQEIDFISGLSGCKVLQRLQVYYTLRF